MMSMYKMQLDTAVREKSSSHSLQLSPQIPWRSNMKPQTGSSGSHTIWPKKNPPGIHKRLFVFLQPIGYISSISLLSELVLCMCRAGGMKLMRV